MCFCKHLILVTIAIVTLSNIGMYLYTYIYRQI